MFSHYPDIMSVNDLRSALGIGRTKAYELINSGEIKSIKVGKSIKIPKIALLDYIRQSGYNTVEADKCRYHEGGFS
jgi:excisionase family DNA binding protein